MTKTSGKKLNLLKSLEILQSNSFISFYHFNNLSKKEWDEIKIPLKELLRTERVALNLKSFPNKTWQADKTVTKKAVPRNQHTCALQPLGWPFLGTNELGNLFCKESGNKETNQLTQLVGSASQPGGKQGTVGKQSCEKPHLLTKEETNFAGEKEVSQLLVLKSKAVVKLLGRLLLNLNPSGFPSWKTEIGNQARGCEAILSTEDTNLGLKWVSYFGEPRVANQETAFKDRVSSLTKALSFIEGPTLLIGANTVTGFKESANLLEKKKEIVFVGGVLENQFINHLDLKMCLNKSLCSVLDLVQTLKWSLIIPFPAYCSNKLLFLLQTRQDSLRDC